MDVPGVVVELGDGRVLAADDVGDPDGTPVLYLHGAPDCRLARHPDDGDRRRRRGAAGAPSTGPGYGGSDPLPAPDPRTWAPDVEVLVDRLGIDSLHGGGVVGRGAVGVRGLHAGRFERRFADAHACTPFACSSCSDTTGGSPSRAAAIARAAAIPPAIVVMHGSPRATAARRIS